MQLVSTVGSRQGNINIKQVEGTSRRRAYAMASLFAAVAAAGLFSSAPQSHAATLYWNQALGSTAATQGGTGAWDTSSSLWSTTQTTATVGAYTPNTNATLANFSGTAGTVTIGPSTQIVTGGITFGTSGYTIAGGAGGTLNLSGATVYTNTQLSIINETISANIVGSGFTINPTQSGSGSRTLVGVTLSGNNTFSGTLTISNKGIVAITSGAALGTSGNAISMTNSTLQYTGTGETISNHNITGLTTSVQETIDSDGGAALTWAGNFSTTQSNNNLQLAGVTGWMNTFSGTIAGSTTSQVILNSTSDAHYASSWYLSNTGNTYGGGTTVNTGTLQIAGDGSLGAVTGTLTLNTGAVIKGDGNSAISLSASRGVMFSGTGFTIDGGGQNFTVNGPVTSTLAGGTSTLTVQNLGSGGVLSLAQVTINPSNQQTMGTARTLALATGTGVGSNVSIAGLTHNNPANLPENFTLSSAYTGTATITGPSTITGNITVSPGTGGQLVIKDNKALGFGGNYNLNNSIGAVTVSSGSLDLYGSTVNKVINLGGGTLINSNTGAAAVISNGITGVTFTSGGSGFSMADVGAALTFTGGGSGSGAAASITSLGFGAGTVTASGGTGWVTGNTITVSGGNSALSATYNVTASGGAITGLTLATAGFGFTSTTGLTYTGAKGNQSSFSGTGATYTFHDSTLAVANIATSAAGSGYTTTPTITGTASTTGSGLTASVTNSYVYFNASTTSLIGGTGGDITINTPIYSGTGGGFTKTGTDTLTLAGAGSYTGATTVSAGTLSLTGSLTGTAITVGTNGTFTESSTGAIAGTTGLTTSGTTTLVGTANTYTGSTTVNGGTLTITGTSAAPTTLASAIVLNTGGTINANSYTTVTGFTDNSTTAANFGGVIADPTAGKGTVTVTAGNLTLSGANTYTGVTTISGGTLTLTSNNSLGNAPAALTAGQITFNSGSNSETLAISGGNVSLAANQGVTLGNNTTATIPVTLDAGGNVFQFKGPVMYYGQTTGSVLTINSTGSGYVDFNGGFQLAYPTATIARTLGISGNGNLTVDSAIVNNSASAANGLNFLSTYHGTATFSGINTYTGVTTINGGTLSLSGSLTGTAITVNTGGTLSETTTGTINGTTGLTNAGGTTTLGGSNTYTGATNVTSGTLNLPTGSLAATAISISGGATMQVGTLTATGSVTLAGGSTAPTQGILSMANDGLTTTFNLNPAVSGTTVLTLGGTTTGTPSILDFDIGPSLAADNINLGANGKLKVQTGGGIINITGIAGYGAGTYNLLTFATGNANGLSGLTLVGQPTSSLYSFALGNNANNEYLVVTSLSNNAYWTGTNGTAWNASPSNFTVDAAGTSSTMLSSASDVTFSKTGGVAAVTTTLGVDTTINSLTFAADQTNGIIIGAGNTLTINAGAGLGITVASGSGAHTIAAGVALGTSQSWTNNSANALTVSGAISGASTTTLSTAGSGATVLSGTNTSFSGPVSITAGTLRISDPTNLGDGSATNTLTINSGTLELTGNSTVDMGINRSISIGSFGGTVQIDGTGALTISGVTSGGGSLTQTGSGTLILTGSSTGTGGTIINGTLKLGAGTNGGLASGPLTALASGSTIESTTSAVRSINSPLIIGASTSSPPVTVNMSNLTFNSYVHAFSTSGNADAIVVGPSSTVTFNGPLAANAMGNALLRGFVFDGSGTVVINGSWGRIADNPGTTYQAGATLNGVYALTTVLGPSGADYLQTASTFTGTLKLTNVAVGANQVTVNGGTLLVDAADTVTVNTGITGTFTAGSNVITGVSAADIAKVTVGNSLEGGNVFALGYTLQEAAVVATNSLAGTITISEAVHTSGSASNVTAGLPSVFGDSQLTATLPVLLGSTTGSAKASILIDGNYTVQHLITLQSGTTGTLTLGATSNATTAGFAGNITLGSGTNTGQNLVLAAPTGVELDVAGAILRNGTSSSSVTISGGGVVKLTSTSSTYTGGTIVSAGELDAAALPTDTALSLTGGSTMKLTAGASNNVRQALSSLSLGAASTIDLTNHDLLITHGLASTTLLNYLDTIKTSTVAAPYNGSSAATVIAWVSGADYNAVTGAALNSNDLLGKFTYAGDADLDGVINADDYLALDLGYMFGLTGWTHGDFAQTGGTVTVTDFAIIDNSYLHQSGSVADSEIALHAQWFGAAYTDAFNALNAPAAVPEPASLALLGLSSLCLLKRRR